MAQPATLHRFRIELSDIDRGVYENLDFRIAMHPSESILYLMTRVLAYSLNFQDHLEFNTAGLSDPDQPGLFITEPRGGYKLWIEIGNPSARKLHKASKLAQLVRVYTYKDPLVLIHEIQGGDVFKSESIDIFSLDPKFLENLGAKLSRDNSWNLLYNDGRIDVTAGDFSSAIELRKHELNHI